MTTLERLYGLADRVAQWLAAAGVALLMLMTLVLMADISTRKTLNFAILGTIDLTQLAVMLAVFFALPLAFLHESHVNVDFFTSRLPPRALAALHCATALLSSALLVAIVWYSFGQARIQHAQGDRSMTLGIPMLVYWVPMLIGSALSVAATLLIAAREAARTAGMDVAQTARPTPASPGEGAKR